MYSINNLRTVKSVEVKAFRHSVHYRSRHVKSSRVFLGVPLDGCEASERGRFVLPVMYLRLSLLTRQLLPAACCRTHQAAGCCGPRSRHAARLLVLRAFRATAPAEIQELLRDDGVVAPDDPVMQELAPLVAAVQTLPPVTRQQLQQLWQGTLQLVQGGSGTRQPALAHDAGAMTDARTPAA